MDKNILREFIISNRQTINLSDQNHYYLWDENLDMYKVSKDKYNELGINLDDFLYLSYPFYNNSSNLIFKHLFIEENVDIPFIRYFIIDPKDLNLSSINNILLFLEELIGKVYILQIKDLFVVFHENEETLDFKAIINTIYDDLGIALKIFEGVVIYDKDDFFTIFLMYNKFLKPLSHHYLTISDLILRVQEEGQELSTLRKIILRNIENDYQLVNLIHSLFANNLNVSKTSQAVYMHRNTLNNKLEFIKNETSLSLQSFNDAVSMYLLLKAK